MIRSFDEVLAYCQVQGHAEIGGGGDFRMTEDGAQVLYFLLSVLFIKEARRMATITRDIAQVLECHDIPGGAAEGIVGSRALDTFGETLALLRSFEDWHGALAHLADTAPQELQEL